jgi:hypothetical protein
VRGGGGGDTRAGRTVYAGDDERTEGGIGSEEERGEGPEVLAVEEETAESAVLGPSSPRPRPRTGLHYIIIDYWRAGKRLGSIEAGLWRGVAWGVAWRGALSYLSYLSLSVIGINKIK